MPYCVFNTCCGCIELKTGCLIIGYLELIGLIVYAMMYMLSVDVTGIEEEDPIAAAVTVYLTVLIGIILSIVFLVDIYKNTIYYMRYTLILSTIALVFGIAGLIFGIGKKSAVEIASTVILSAWNVFSVMVIRSYYYKTVDNEGPGAPSLLNTNAPIESQ